jgi:hypothetical protein
MESRKQYRVLRAANALIKLGDGPREEILTALQRLIEAATAASPLRAVPGAAPDWVDRVVREADLKIASSVIEELEQYYEHSN